MSEALVKAESNGDPNGIRTRVTAVKGRCPRPLDDRVVEPPNIPFVSRKATSLVSARRCKIDNQLCGAGGSATMPVQDFPRVLHHFLSLVGVCQEMRHGSAQFGRRVDLNRAAFCTERRCQRR